MILKSGQPTFMAVANVPGAVIEFADLPSRLLTLGDTVFHLIKRISYNDFSSANATKVADAKLQALPQQLSLLEGWLSCT
jgi:hypothetical protein